MDFSIMFFGSDSSERIDYDSMLEYVRFADQNGFSAVWTPERHFGDFGAAFPSPSVLGSALSMITEQIHIRSGSVVLPLNDPIRVAEEWALIDNLSKGRIGLSVASGWRPDDFIFPGSNYPERNQQMKQRIEELKKIWKGESVVRKNGEGQDFNVKIRPAPVTKALPLWVTASGRPDTFAYAGEIGANLLTHMLKQSTDKLEESIAIYHQALRENGFNVEDRNVAVMLHTYLDDSEAAARQVCAAPFKDYLRSTLKLMDSKTKQITTDASNETLVDLAYQKYDRNNTLIGSPESSQELMHELASIGVTEIACLLDFGLDNAAISRGLPRILEAKRRYDLSTMYLAS